MLFRLKIENIGISTGTYHGIVEINLMLGGYNFAPLTFITLYILLQFWASHA